VRARLPLLDIALPALRGLTPVQYQLFRQNVNRLVQADDAVDPFERALHRILLPDAPDPAHITGVASTIRRHCQDQLDPGSITDTPSGGGSKCRGLNVRNASAFAW
jgi:hypothetical protein